MIHLNDQNYIFLSKGDSGSISFPIAFYGEAYCFDEDDMLIFQLRTTLSKEVVLQKEFTEKLELSYDETISLEAGHYIYSVLLELDEHASSIIMDGLPFIVKEGIIDESNRETD